MTRSRITPDVFRDDTAPRKEFIMTMRLISGVMDLAMLGFLGTLFLVVLMFKPSLLKPMPQ